MPEQESGGKKTLRKRARGYDAAVLRYIGYYRVVTLHQIIYRFFIMAGMGPGYGFRLVRGLQKRGLVETRPLDSDKGTVSRALCTLTREGWQYLGRDEEPKSPKRANVSDLLEYRLQFAEMMLEREAEGWVLLVEEQAWGRIKKWGMSQYAGRALNEYERLSGRRIERMPPLSTGLNVLWHRNNGDIRFILPVRWGKSISRTLEKLPPSLGLFPPLQFEMVGADLELTRAAASMLARWGEGNKITLAVHQVANFRTRNHPGQAQARNIYGDNNVPDPGILL